MTELPQYDQALLDALIDLGHEHDPETVAMAAVSLSRHDDDVEVYTREDGQFGWRLKAGNHEGIATPGEGYADKSYAIEVARRSTWREPVDRT